MAVTLKNCSADSARKTARREQVMLAARSCFCQFGFHSASMATIADQAGMSVGHIYRYFSGKEAIIAAIVHDQIDQLLHSFPDSRDFGNAEVPKILMANLCDAARQASDDAQTALMLEIHAEACRNPAIAEIVRDVDLEIFTRVRNFILSRFPHDAIPLDIDQRVKMLSIIMNGVVLRGPSLPSFDAACVARLLQLAIDAIFSEFSCDSVCPEFTLAK